MDYGALNSATKYPSILTYHGLDPRNGNLLESEVTLFTGPVILTEKVDGTNGRIIQMPGGDFFIGSREELLYAKGDRIQNPSLGIVPALLHLAESITSPPASADYLQVFFTEVYGHRIGQGAKQYTGTGQISYRLFDVALVPLSILGQPREKIAAWRDAGGQEWTPEPDLQATGIPLTPRLATVDAASLPATLGDTQEFLRKFLPATQAPLDTSAGGRGEGIVLRTPDRSQIAKARFQDYERTARKRGK